MENAQRALEQIRKLRAEQGSIKDEIESYWQKISGMQDGINQSRASHQETASHQEEAERARKQEAKDEEEAEKAEEQVDKQRSDDEQRKDEK